MDKFEMYMIDTIKFWSDKLKAHADEQDPCHRECLEVVSELTNAYVAYKNIQNGGEYLSYLEEDEVEKNKSLVSA